MQVGINLLYLIPGVVGGTETYARQLIISLLSKIEDSDKLIVFCSREMSATIKSTDKLIVATLPFYSENRVMRLFAEQILLPIACLKYSVSILLSLGYTQPIFLACKSIVTIHDLNWYYHPEDFSMIPRIFLKYLTISSAKHASGVIAISNSTKESLIKVLKINQEKITVIYHGMTKSAVGGASTDLVKSKYHLPKRYILTILSHYAHKNLATLIKAFISVQKDLSNIHLVIGGTGTNEARLERQKYISSQGNKNIQLLPFIDGSDLDMIYDHATIFVFPSAYEGFGLPVLEAMSHGIPVISSDASSLKEVVGSGGILVDPYDVNQYIMNIKQLLKSNELRHKYIIAGTKQVKKFTWEKCGDETLALIKKIYESS